MQTGKLQLDLDQLEVVSFPASSPAFEKGCPTASATLTPTRPQ